MKKALITGISGQDRAYLVQHLLNNGYKVFGGERRNASSTLWRLDALNILNDVEIIDFELAEFTNIMRAIEYSQPDEISRTKRRRSAWEGTQVHFNSLRRV